jgi:hypothetical protein
MSLTTSSITTVLGLVEPRNDTVVVGGVTVAADDPLDRLVRDFAHVRDHLTGVVGRDAGIELEGPSPVSTVIALPVPYWMSWSQMPSANCQNGKASALPPVAFEANQSTEPSTRSG